MSTMGVSPICAHCGKSAERACTGCKDAPAVEGDFKTTFYCSSACQKEDWKYHKKLCKRLQNRKLLYRAGSILQEMFYVYREKMFDKLIVRIDKTAGRLVVHEGRYSPVVTAETDCLIRFPTKLCETDKKSVLVHLACDDASAWLHDILKYTLKGIASNITEVRGVVKNKKLEITAVDVKGNLQNTDFEHEFLKVKLLNGGKEYALDFTSAQYGYFEPVVPWREYGQSRISKLVTRKQFDYFGGAKDAMLARKGKSTVQGIVANLNAESSKELLASKKEWEEDHSMPFLSILKLPLPEFKEREKNLVALFAENLTQFHKWMKSDVEKHNAMASKTQIGESRPQTQVKP